MSFIIIDGLPVKNLLSGLYAQYIHGEKMTIGFVTIEKDSVIPTHSHIHEQITHVLEGQLLLTVENEEKILQPGMVAVIPSQHVHSAEALTDCKVIDVFSPVREDYR